MSTKSMFTFAGKGTATYRKSLRHKVRNGEYAVAYLANKAMGFPVYALVGETYRCLSDGFTAAKAAIEWCERKFKATPRRMCKVQKAAA